MFTILRENQQLNHSIKISFSSIYVEFKYASKGRLLNIWSLSNIKFLHTFFLNEPIHDFWFIMPSFGGSLQKI